MAEQFETVVKKHGETLIWNILDNWEHHHCIRHTRPMTLEERWEHFICATEFASRVAA